MKKLVALMTAAIVLAMACAAQAAPLKLRMAGQQPVDHLCTKMMQDFAKEIKAKTQGRVEITVHPANQLGDYDGIMEELIRGTIDMSVTSFSSKFDPRFDIVYTNGIVSDYEGAKKTFNPDAWLPKKLEQLGKPLGVVVIGSYIEGFIGIASKKEVKEPLNPKVDKGVLVRVAAMDVYNSGAKAMGFRPITIPWADIYQSMQTGVCDAVDGMSTAAAYTTLRDVMKYWYATNYSFEYLPMMVSAKTWAKISPADQKVIKDAARKFTLKSIDTAKAEDTKYMNEMRKKGIKVYTYTAKELQPIRKAIVANWEDLKKSLTPELVEEMKKNIGK